MMLPPPAYVFFLLGQAVPAECREAYFVGAVVCESWGRESEPRDVSLGRGDRSERAPQLTFWQESRRQAGNVAVVRVD